MIHACATDLHAFLMQTCSINEDTVTFTIMSSLWMLMRMPLC